MADRDSVLEEHHATISLLQAMYPLESELELPSTTQAFLEDPSALDSGVDSISLMLSTRPNQTTLNGGADAEEVELSYTITLSFPEFSAPSSSSASTLPKCSIYLRQPAVLTRAEHSEVLSRIRTVTADELGSEYILEILDSTPQYVSEVLSARPTIEGLTGGVNNGIGQGDDVGELERVWFWFPSLSSKEKRRDLVEFGQEAGLTGFVLAGKPGLLCVEGTGLTVDRYMARIKSESWRDIPPGHKKVTERLRIPISTTSADLTSSTSTSIPKQPRQLPKLVDISDEISRYGTYAHRAEMSEVRKIVDQWGVGDEMAKVLMG